MVHGYGCGGSLTPRPILIAAFTQVFAEKNDPSAVQRDVLRGMRTVQSWNDAVCRSGGMAMHALSNQIRTIDMACERTLSLDTIGKCQVALESNHEDLNVLHKRVRDMKDDEFSRTTANG